MGARIDVSARGERKVGERELGDFLALVDGGFPVPLSERVDLSSYPSKLLDAADIVAARSDDGRICSLVAGYATGSVDRRAYVSVVATDPKCRGRGLARAALREFEMLAKRLGRDEVHLYCDRSNAAAAGMYRSLGYRDASDPGDPRPGDLHFHRALGVPVPWLTPERPNVLLSSAGRRTYLVEWFREALGGAGAVVASNSDPDSPALAAADAAAVSPLIYSDEYVPFMLDLCRRERVGAVVPLFDVDVPVLAAHRAEFEAEGVFPVVAPEAFARACADKLEASRLLGAAGVAAPATYLGPGPFLEAVARGEESFPAFIKPRWGMGSIGLATARDEEELRFLCGMVSREVARSYLRYESGADPEHAVVVQGLVRGAEYGMDVVCDLSGGYRACVVRRKAAMRAGETDCAEVLTGDPRFEALARRLAGLSGHPGNMDVDVFELPDGSLEVLEMNARFGGGYPFSHAAGVDLPRALVSWLRGGECDPADLEVDEPGLYMKDIRIARLRGGR